REIERAPLSAELHLARATAQRMHGDLAACESDLARAAGLAGSDGLGGIELERARLERERGRLDGALECSDRELARAACTAGLRIQSLELRAEVLTELGRCAEAVATWDALIAYHPTPRSDRFLARAAL